MGLDTSKDINPNAARGYILEKFTKHKGGINCLYMDNDRHLMVTGGEDRTVKLWRIDASPTHCKGSMEGHAGYITSVVIHLNFILSGSADNMIRKWCLNTQKCLFIYEGHTDRVNRILCAGDLLFSTSVDKSVRMWALVTGPKMVNAALKIFEGHTKPIFPIAFIPSEDSPLDGQTISDKDIIITGSSDKTARIWSMRTATSIHILKGHTGTVNALVVDPEGTMLFTGGGDGLICCWNVESGECIRKMKGHETAILTMIGHNKMLYSGSVDQTARAWIMEFGECIKIYRGHTHSVVCLNYHQGYLYTGCSDTCSRMFKARTGDCKRTFKGHTLSVLQLEAVYDKLYTVSADGTLRVWDTTGILDDDDDEATSSEPKLQKVEVLADESRTINE